MMKPGNVRLWVWLLVMLPLLAACISPLPTPSETTGKDGAVTPPEVAGAPAQLPNILTFEDAHVEVRRKDSSSFVPVTVGAEVSPGDVVHLKEGDAGIFCGEEQRWKDVPLPLPLGQNAGVPCGFGRPSRLWPGIVSLRLRSSSAASSDSEDSAELLVVLKPRSGWVMNDRPALAWQAIDGASTYTVTLDGDDGVHRSSITTSATELAYPEEWEPLQGEGASYWVIVEASNGITSLDTPGFSLLSPEESAHVQSVAERLRELPLDETTQNLLLADFYLTHELWTEAMELLEALPEAAQLPAVQQKLGEVYLGMGITGAAQRTYERTLEMAQAGGFLESEASALVGLGRVACIQFDAPQAVQYWTEALALYEQFEYEANAQEVKELLGSANDQCH
jgi:hypothetical protein